MSFGTSSCSKLVYRHTSNPSSFCKSRLNASFCSRGSPPVIVILRLVQLVLIMVASSSISYSFPPSWDQVEGLWHPSQHLEQPWRNISDLIPGPFTKDPWKSMELIRIFISDFLGIYEFVQRHRFEVIDVDACVERSLHPHYLSV